LTPLNEDIPERGFKDVEFILNLPNRLIVELIWPNIIKGEEKNSQVPIKEALKMRFLSIFWLTIDVILDMHCSYILKRSAAQRAAAPGRFRY
jgi:hypothetical protein